VEPEVVSKKRHLALGAAILALSLCALFSTASGKSTQAPLFATVSEGASMPIGWAQFCETYEGICDTTPSTPRDVVLDGKAWSGLTAVNEEVNHSIQPMTDMDHYGMIQWWRYPDDGIGSCHSYALLKRRLLIEAGWPREALLMTIVRTDYGRGEGHAVLTVKTDRGDFILDNLTDEIRLWSRTPYLYYKRQSQADPNMWVRISDRHVAGTPGIAAR
jgi:predicted transglutaminase-like cysteine proteinase